MRNILIVDTNSLVRQTIARTLKNEDQIIAVYQARNKEEALIGLRTCNIDIMSTSVRGIGLEFLHEVKKLYPKLPVLILTGFVDGDVINTANKLGYRYMQEPADIDLLKKIYLGKEENNGSKT